MTFSVNVDVDGVTTDLSSYVKNITGIREAGGVDRRIIFTGAVASDYDIVMTPANVDLGTDPLGSSVEIQVGLASQETAVITGVIKNVFRSVPDGVVTVTVGDKTHEIVDERVDTPTLRNVNSAIFMREIIENTGVTNRALSADNVLVAIDFDANDERARAWLYDKEHLSDLSAILMQKSLAKSGPPKAENTYYSNEIPTTMISPNPLYPLSRVEHLFVDSERSQCLYVKARTLSAVSEISSPGDDLSRLIPDFISPLDTPNSALDMFEQFKINPAGTLAENWGGTSYDYWLAYQFADPSGNVFGDVQLAASTDGVNFSDPSGPSPFITRSREDSVIQGDLLVDGTRMYYVFREGNSTDGDVLKVTYSDNVVGTWSTPNTIATGSYGSLRSPSVDKVGSVFHIWVVDESGNLQHATADSLITGTIAGWNGCTVESIPYGEVWNASIKYNSVSGDFRAIMVLSEGGSSSDIYMNAYSYRSDAGDTFGMLSKEPVLQRPEIDVPPIERELGHGGVSQVFDGSTVEPTVFSDFRTDGGSVLGSVTLSADEEPWIVIRNSGNSDDMVMWNFEDFGGYAKNTIMGSDVDLADMWAEDANEQRVSFGGWFAWPDGITFGSSGMGQLLMQIGFKPGRVFALDIDDTGDIRLSYWSSASGSYAEIASVTAGYTGANNFAADAMHFIGAEIVTRKDGTTYPEGKLVLNIDGTKYEGSWVGGTTNEYSGLWYLSQVAIIESFITSFAADHDTSFPNTKYDNLFVGLGATPTTVPEPEYRLDVGLSMFSACSYSGSSPWNELRLLAESELGFIVWDSDNVLRFYNRHHFIVSDSTSLSVKSIDDENQVLSVTTDLALDRVVNAALVYLARQEWYYGFVWEAGSTITVEADSEFSFWVELPGVPVMLDGLVKPNSVFAGSAFRASPVYGYGNSNEPLIRDDGKAEQAGGFEKYVSMTITAYGRRVLVTVGNSATTNDVTLKDRSGDNYLKLWGRMLEDSESAIAGSAPIIEAEDESSIALYGRHETVIDLPYIFNRWFAETYAQFLIGRQSAPIEVIEGIEIVGDSRLEVGDVVTLTIPQLSISGEFWIQRIRERLSPERGYRQTLTVIDADVISAPAGDGAGWFILDESTFDGPDVLVF